MKPVLCQFVRHWGLRLALVLSVAVGCWGAGFLWFLRLTSQEAQYPGMADGIVVLTGGADRVELALHLLSDGRADKLLISGIGGGADLSVLGRGSGVDTAALARRITLGRHANSTFGNAQETAAWVNDNQIRSLLVVTAYYHMPRALVELRHVLPDTTLLAEPVLLPGGTKRTLLSRLMAEEYSKYLIALTGVTAWLPVRDTPRHTGHAG